MRLVRFASLLTLFSFLLGIPVTDAYAQEPGEPRIYSTFVTRGVNSATVEWKTDPETKGLVEYADETGEWQKTPWQDDFTKDHLMTILNLKPNTSYIYRISAETTTGVIKTYRSSFNTLDEKILGTQTSTPATTNGFQTILTPTTAQLANQPYGNYPYPQTLGAQAYPPIPYVQNIYPNVLAQAQTQPAITQPPTPTPELTPTPTIIATTAGLTSSSGSTNILLGVLIGMLITVLIYQLLTRSNIKIQPSQIIQRNDTPQQKDVHEPENPTNTFRFTVGTDR